MPSPVRLGLVAALAIACHGASAQTVVSPVLSVQRIAPQLVAFAGSQVAGVLALQNPPSPAVQVQSNAAAGATSPGPRTAR